MVLAVEFTVWTVSVKRKRMYMTGYGDFSPDKEFHDKNIMIAMDGTRVRPKITANNINILCCVD